jgi:predicted ester cyclase
MTKPSDPMLEEFRILAETNIQSAHDLDHVADQICALFTEDCILEDLSTTDVVHGRAELHPYCKELFGPYSNVQIEPTEIIDTGTTSIMRLVISGDHTGDLYGYAPTGIRVSFPAIAIYKCNDEMTMVAHETLAYDTGFIIAQVNAASGADKPAQSRVPNGTSSAADQRQPGIS